MFMLFRWFVSLNNGFTRLRRVRVNPEELLLLVPRCLQKTDCTQALGATLDACRACGRCQVPDLIAISSDFGIRCSLAAGGREALFFVSDTRVHVVVAVACEKELFQGIIAVFPKPVLGVMNIQTNGPCRNTRFDPDAVRAAVASMLKPGKEGRFKAAEPPDSE
ncbi:MAG: DUF116 domain-containing protein [Pontiellaceae bacterium]|nr:DUF116 domain-containing protein [Pontiellaceae bacterium]